jgi:hypothetical protein
MKKRYKFLLALLLVGSFLVNWIAYVHADHPHQENPWGEVIDGDGNILYGNLTDLGEIQVDAEWMPDVPFIDGQATYHQYLTPSGNIVVMPSATTLFFMALNPEVSGIDDASYALGNGLGVFETMLAGYVSPEDLAGMGYTDASEFYQALIDGETNIFTFDFMGNLLWDLLTSSLADQNLYTMLLLYTAGNCDAVPGGCPADMDIPTPPEPPVCPAPYIETGPDAQVWLNADYLTRILKASSGELTIKVGKPQEPVLVKSGDLVALIMPLLCATDPFENETAIPIPFEQAAPAAALAQADAAD